VSRCCIRSGSEEAEKAFLEVEKQDPKCAMAYWGEAMSLWHEPLESSGRATIKRASAELKKAGKMKAGTTEARARLHPGAEGVLIPTARKRTTARRAMAYSVAMEKVYRKYPDDHEAAAFYALSLLAAEPDNDTTFANRKEAGAVLEKAVRG